MKNLTTTKFGLLTVIKLSEVKHYHSTKNTQTKAYWLCRCECGKEKIVRGEHLVSGNTTSCGAAFHNNRGNHLKTHGLSNTPEHRSWVAMRNRIHNQDAHRQKYYSGISIDPRWNSFEQFLADMGPKPTPKHEIDRINNDGNYEPGNCRWATRREQMRNTRRANR